ncbi:Bme4 protein [Neorhizobium galegae bv. orientalis]|nr:Bme4 protein [Neorhizobium galegae bv. orientalis]
MTPLDAKTSDPRLGAPSFTLRHRLFRLAWTLVWSLFGRWTPVPLFAWRRFLLRRFGARIDRTARIYPGVAVWYPPNLAMAAYSCLGRGVNCYCMDRIELGTHAIVSQGAHLCTGTHDIDDANFQLVTRPIVVGANAWIAAETFVGPGVVVGEGAVLGARAVTFRNLDPWTIYAGNPVRRLRRRFEQDKPGIFPVRLNS